MEKEIKVKDDNKRQLVSSVEDAFDLIKEQFEVAKVMESVNNWIVERRWLKANNVDLTQFEEE